MVKIKEIRITANYAWSPKSNHPVYIAAGTAAQQLDATFSSNASLELYAIDITENSLVAKQAGKVDVKDRFHKIVWGSTYTDSPNLNGLVVCGTDKGGIEIYDPDKILDSSDDCLVFSTSNHTGPVRALDFNAFQKNLFASGANDSEIFIWDLKNPSNPMTPGNKSQPLSAISSIVWNQQVQHILASTSTLSSGPCCVVWDLRKNEPIIKVQDPSGRMQCSDAAWHPEVATQLVLASEDDHLPVVQLWDLRFATSPMKVLEKHKRGVVSLAWCPQDPDLLLTCGKDNSVYCWNPNSSPPEVVSELDTHAQWCFDVQWCPRNPNMLSSGSFDGHISIHSLMGGDGPAVEESATQVQQNAVAEAFGTNTFPVDQKPASVPTKRAAAPLKIPPKWMRRPCGATFSFGGKLVVFQNPTPDENQSKQGVRRNIIVNQVITEDNLVKRSNKLRSALRGNEQCADYCQQKINNASNEFEEDFWNFVKVNFNPDPRKNYLQLLGYNSADLQAKFEAFTDHKLVNGDLSSQVDDLTVSAKGEPTLSNNSSSNALDAFEQIAAANDENSAKAEVRSPMVIPTDDGNAELSNLTVNGVSARFSGRRQSTLSLLPQGDGVVDYQLKANLKAINRNHP